MSALLAPVEEWVPQSASEREWETLRAASPQVVATIDRYLAQLSTFLAPRSVEKANTTLRQLVRWLVATPTSPPSPTSPGPTSRTTRSGWPPGPA